MLHVRVRTSKKRSDEWMIYLTRLKLQVTIHKLQVRIRRSFRRMTNYLFKSIQVTSYYLEVTSRGTSYKFELGHLRRGITNYSFNPIQVTISSYYSQVTSPSYKVLEEWHFRTTDWASRSRQRCQRTRAGTCKE